MQLLLTLAVVLPLVLHVTLGLGLAVVSSASMQPAIAPGDLEIVIPTSARHLAIGDVVLLQDAQTVETFSHRIIKFGIDGKRVSIQTKGDGNPSVDRVIRTIDAEASVPRAIYVVPRAGYAVRFLAVESTRIIGLLLVALALLLYLSRSPSTARPQSRTSQANLH
jgi:signal peptidase I